MRRVQFAEWQINGAQPEREAGAKMVDVCRKHGSSSAISDVADRTPQFPHF